MISCEELTIARATVIVTWVHFYRIIPELEHETQHHDHLYCNCLDENDQRIVYSQTQQTDRREERGEQYRNNKRENTKKSLRFFSR